MLIKRAGGHPQLGNHRQEAVPQPPRVPRRGGRRRRGGGGGRARTEALVAGGAAGAARAQARERQEEPAQRPTRSRTRGKRSRPTTTTTSSAPTRTRRRCSRGNFKTEPWTVAVEGECDEERQPARSRTSSRGRRSKSASTGTAASKRWSMVIPWVGFPLADLIKKCEPTSKAKFVEFTTLFDPKQMPGLRSPRAALAVRRRAADGRGDAPADDPRRRPLRRSAAEPERRAAAARRAVEVRLQGHQVDRRRSGSSRSSR